MKKIIKRFSSFIIAIIFFVVSLPLQNNSAKAYSDMAQKILDDSSLGLSADKKRTMATITDTMLNAGFEPAFICGVLGNIAKEGSFGLFEGTTSTGHTDYMRYMTKYYQYYTKYSYKYIYNCNFAEVCKIDAELYAMNYQNSETGRCGFGLGCCQWTFGRTHGLILKYKEIAGNSSTITYEQTMLAECLYIVQELNGSKKSVYTNWKSQNSSNLSSVAAANSAARIFCTQYERPSGYSTEKVQGSRAAMAENIYNVCMKEVITSKMWHENLTPANLGSSFDAIILNKNCWKPIRPNSSSNVFLYKEEWITGEMWRFTRQSDGSYKIVNFSNGQCLDANGAGTTDGTNVGTYNSNDSNAQRWFIYEINGGYVLRAKCGDLVMNLDGNKSADNTNIHLWTYHGGEAQVFSLYHTRGDSVVSDYAKPSPSAPTLTVKSYSSIALSWSATAYTEKYIVYRSTDNSTWKKMGEATSTSYTDTGLTAKTKYYYKIEAVNRFYTVSSPSASATTSETPRYTVVFNSNSGSGSMSNQIINRDEATALNANQFRKEGYSFLGWSTDKIATKATYTDKQSVTNLAAGGGTVTLYAIWKANTYKVTLDDGSGETTVIDVTYDSKYNVPDATKDGYHFAGWYTKVNGEGTLISKDTTVKITAAQTLYACWKKDVLAITFNTNGGEAELTEKLVSYDTKYGYLPDATKQGYEFGGWYLDKALTQQITADSIVKITVSQEVYAKWAQVIPIITFDAKGGTAEMDTKQVVMGKTYGVLPDAEKEGCEFIGWFTESGMEIVSDSIVEIAEDTTVYAKWRMKGDADADGDVDIDDVIMLQQWLLAVPDDPLTDWKAVDLCQDERIDVFDLCLLKRLLIERNGD